MFFSTVFYYRTLKLPRKLAQKNTRVAARICAERFPGRVHPTHRTIFRVMQKLRETGCLVHNTRDIPVRRRVQDEERILIPLRSP